jgi:hypothetical protein
VLAAATGRGELAALIDALDMFDVSSASAAGVDLEHVLWVRGHVVINPGLCRDLNQRAVEQAIKAIALVLQAGNFGVVALDVADAPMDALRRLPFTTWLRLQRMVEGTQTACVLVGPEPMARSSAGLTVRLRASGRAMSVAPGVCGEAAAVPSHARLFGGFDVHGQVVRARIRAHEEAIVAFATAPSHDALDG